MKKNNPIVIIMIFLFLVPSMLPLFLTLLFNPIFFLIVVIIGITLISKTKLAKKKQRDQIQNILNKQISIEETIDFYSSVDDNILLDTIIEQELKNNNYNKKYDLQSVSKKKFIVTIIFSVINFIFLASIFFHFPSYKYFLEIINIIVYIVFMKKFNVVNSIKKEIKARPTENISYIISSMVTGNVSYINSKLRNFACILASCVLPLLIFLNPHILYEKVDGGYYVRFYTVGITNFETVTIPSTYKDEKVIGIRGNVFKNMIFLKEVNLPNTIEVIRGGAFKDCKSLVSINLPTEITEIKGNTFEGCTSLKSIKIPDGVTRIGGHAFYGCVSLVDVNIPFSVIEIGSSAFRKCTSLKEINIPTHTMVNERAFKDSPTIKNRYTGVLNG